MSTVNDLYILVTYELCEDLPNGLVLNLLTLQQFIDLTNLVLQDFTQKTCFSSLVQTQQVTQGISRYTFPDIQMRVDEAFLGGILLEPSSVQDLNNGLIRWRTEQSLPTRWHGDELPLKTIELAKIPNYTGVAPTGGPQTGWNVTSSNMTYTPPQHGDLTIVGPQLPATVAELTDPLCFGTALSPTSLIPQDFVLAYLASGVLARIFGSDSELKDAYRAQWHQAIYDEGVSLIKAIMDESSGAGQ